MAGIQTHLSRLMNLYHVTVQCTREIFSASYGSPRESPQCPTQAPTVHSSPSTIQFGRIEPIIPYDPAAIPMATQKFLPRSRGSQISPVPPRPRRCRHNQRRWPSLAAPARHLHRSHQIACTPRARACTCRELEVGRSTPAP